MDSGRFLNELAAELRRIGVDEAVITKRVGQFEKYFATMPPEEAAEMLAGLGDIEDLALNIKALSTKKKKAPDPEPEPEPVKPPEDLGVGDEFDVFSEESTQKEPPVQPDPDKTVEFEPVRESAPALEEETRYIDLNSLREAAREGTLPGAQNTDALYEESLLYDEVQPAEGEVYYGSESTEAPAEPVDEALPLSAEEEQSELSYSDSEYRQGEYRQGEYRHIELDFNELDDTESDIRPTAKGQAIFIVGSILTLPITLPLMLIILIAIGAVFAVTSVLIALLIALLIVIVVAGVVIPLVGIIFGIIKAYTVFPVGLYEIGLGITIAGGAMFVGILVYNLAVRLLPFALKKFGVFSKFLLRSIGKLVKRIRKECVTL
ncbi:MAG: hypothetical protein IJA85_12380 [Clostridia bacterium]|nr:hypothetical protein [Clostridia bacterium]